MALNKRIDAFVQLGVFMHQFSTTSSIKNDNLKYNELYFDKIKDELELAIHSNPWFTPENLAFSFKNWSESLSLFNLTQWTNNYNFNNQNKPKTIGLIMAGNIPLVGFHDLLAVLITGNKALIKLASNDQKIIPILIEYLQQVEPEFEHKIQVTNQKLVNFDAVIATGSNNTSRYFDYYFGKYPNIIRKNRNSVAVLSGNETQEELALLGEDIFRYFGLGCRNVSKIYVPKNYDFDLLFKSLSEYNYLMEYKKYSNNYEYNKAVYLMSLFPILDNGFLILKEDVSYSSPIASLFYEYYDSMASLQTVLALNNEHLQCIVGNKILPNSIPFGSSQSPDLWDYADGIDTIDFLLKLT